MSSDAGTRKRNVQSKKKKASTGSISPGEISVRELPASKLSADESIHVQKDVQFVGNWYMGAVFIVISIALATVVGYYAFFGSEVKETKPATSDWVSSLKFDLFASEKHSQEKPIHEETSVDEEPLSSYLDILWSYYTFGQIDASSYLSSVVPWGKTKREETTSQESDKEKDSHEDYSEELFNDDKNDDENEHESEENQDDEKNTTDEDDQKDEDSDENDDSKSTDDSENTYKSYFSYKKSDVEDDEKDDVDSSDENEKKADRRDQRFNYYHQKSDEEHKYKYIKGEDDSNDSSEQGAHEKFDSGENTKDEDEKSDEDRENDSHSSEEEDPSDEPLADDTLESEDPETDEHDFNPIVDEAKSESPGTDEKPESGSINRVADEALNNIGNDRDLIDVAQTITENLLDSINGKSSETENKTLEDYLETPSNSASEQSEDDSASESVADKNIPIDSKNSQTASETESEVEDDEYAEYGKSNYKRMNITNRADWPYRHQLDEADDDWDRKNILNATIKYAAILKQHPRSVRAQYGMVRFHDWKSDKLRNNTYLHNVIRQYKQLLKTRDIPQAIEKIVYEKIVQRLRFLGKHEDCIPVHKMLIQKYPEELSYQNDLATTYLILNRHRDAEIVLKRLLKKDSNHGLALANYGYIKKINGELEIAITVLTKAIQSGMEGTEDRKFYYQLGEALQRTGRMDEASKLFETAAKKGIFPSKYQRPVYNFLRLRAKPWWNPDDTVYQRFFRRLEKNWKIIRDEVISVIKKKNYTIFRDEEEQLRETGEWKQLELIIRGKETPDCRKFPVTCGMIKEFAPAATCRQGQVKFSLIKPGTHVWPHCGPTNARLRAHLGLIIPKNVFIRVAEETRTWKEGKVLLFDDSFEHEVWHNGTLDRLVLIIDVWHFDLSPELREIMPNI